MALILSFFALGVAGGTFLAREDFAAVAAYRYRDLFPEEAQTVNVRTVWTQDEGRSVTVVVAEPVSANAAPPFGLGEWPEPGHFLASPDLDVAGGLLAARFGVFDGSLGEEYLPSADSRIVFARPLEPMADDWSASGFGVSGDLQAVATASSGFFTATRIALPTALLGIFITVSIPAMLLLGTIASAVLRKADRQTQMLEVLGADPWRLTLVRARALAPGILIGVAIAAATVLLASTTGIQIPVLGFTVRSVDIVRHPGPYLLAAVIGVVIAIAVAALASYPPKLARANRPRSANDRRPRYWLAALCIAAVVASSQMAVTEAEIGIASGEDRGAVLWAIGGSLLAMIAMPWIVRSAGALASKALVAAGRNGHPASLIVGRSLAGSAVRVAAAGAALMVLTGLAATWTLMGSAPAVSAQRGVDAVDGRFVTVSPPGAGSSTIPPREVIASLAPEMLVMRVDTEMTELADGTHDFSTTLVATPRMVQQLKLPHGAVEATALPANLAYGIDADGTNTVTVVEGSPTEESTSETVRSSYIVLAEDGSRVSATEIQRALSSVGGPGWVVSSGGETWIVGANDLAYEFRWIYWFASLGCLLAILAIWLRTNRDQMVQVGVVRPIDALFSSRSVMSRVLWLRSLVLIALTLVTGAGCAAILARVTSGSLSTSGGATPVIIATAFAIAIAMAGVAAPGIRRAATAVREWMPGRDG